MFFACLEIKFHLLKDFKVILAFNNIIGILFSFAVIIRFGQISESTKNIAEGFHIFIKFCIRNLTSIGRNLC